MKTSRKKSWIIVGTNFHTDKQSFFGPFTLRQAKQRAKILSSFVKNIQIAALTHIA